MYNISYSHMGNFDVLENKMIINIQSVDYQNRKQPVTEVDPKRVFGGCLWTKEKVKKSVDVVNLNLAVNNLIEKYDKLVRDKIPEIIKLKGDIPSVEILCDEQYFHALNRKISEEVAEYLEDYSVNELADIIEVIYAIVKYKGLSLHEFEQIRLKKCEERGGFDNRISLVDVRRNLEC